MLQTSDARKSLRWKVGPVAALTGCGVRCQYAEGWARSNTGSSVVFSDK